MTQEDAIRYRAKALEKWQNKLLPWMVTLLSIALLFFLVATLVQLFSLQSRINAVPALQPAVGQDAQSQLLNLEAYSIQRRFHVGGLMMMARLWVVYLGFVTGMILALVGAAFILGKLEEQQSEASGKIMDATFAFKSTSPGLIMTGFGTVLMLGTLLTPQKIAVEEQPLYVTAARLTQAKDPLDAKMGKSLENSRREATNDAVIPNFNPQ